MEREYVVSPGDHIQGWLEDHALSPNSLQEALNLTSPQVSDLLCGILPLSKELAQQLQTFTGTEARIWMRFEQSYRQNLLRRNPTVYCE